MELSVESWAACERELSVLWPRHWQEISIIADKVPCDVDCDGYRSLESLDRLHLVTARVAGVLVGYHISIIAHYMHAMRVNSALVDVFYLTPETRKGFAGIRLFRFAERTLKDRGVQFIVGSSSNKRDCSALFERLGWVETERQFSKFLGA